MGPLSFDCVSGGPRGGPPPLRWRTWGLRAATPTPGHLKVRAEVLEIVGLKRFMGCKGLLPELC